MFYLPPQPCLSNMVLSFCAMDFYERIKHAIEESNANVQVVADRCDVSVQAVYAWKRGDVKNLRNEHLFELADVTGFEARWIATGKGPERPTGGDERKRILSELYDASDERGRSTILRVAEQESSYRLKPKADNDVAA